MRNKLQRQVIEDFIRWAVARIEMDKANFNGKKVRDRAKEREWALKMICEKADMEEVLEKIQGGATL